MYLTILKSS